MKRIRPFFIFSLIFTTWLAWSRVLEMLGLQELNEKGQSGDSFGSLNTLFTGLAFAGLAWSIKLQIGEITKRDDESEHNAFESRFFHLHNALREVVSCMQIKYTKNRVLSLRSIMPDGQFPKPETETAIGKDVFTHIADRLDKSYKSNAATSEEDRTYAIRIAEIIEIYDDIYRRHNDDLGPYFRMLFRIFKFLERAPDGEKHEYAKIIRAELSGSEVYLLSVNGLSKEGVNFLPIIEKYNLRKHHPNNRTLNKEFFDTEYNSRMLGNGVEEVIAGTS